MKTKAISLINKNEWITDRIKGETVLHVGCTDWPLTAERVDNKDLLHSMLCNLASRCVGIDLDEEGVRTLRGLMPMNELYVLNAENLKESEELADTQWDFIVAGDVLEHMNNPGLFFESAMALLKDQGTLIVTVPSAFSAKRFFWLLATGVENVHFDHTAYYSESTLTRLGERHGFEITKIYGFQWKNPTFKNRISKVLAAPLIWLSSGRLADELAVEYRKLPSTCS